MRFETSPGCYRAMTALLLLGPWSPLLFQGQEFGATSPFVFFTDIGDENLRKDIRQGRFHFLAQFPSLATAEAQRSLPDPIDRKNFERCKLDFSERTRNSEFYGLHQDLIRLRKTDSRFRKQIPGGVDGAVLGEKSFLLRYFGEQTDERLLLVNFGPPQPLIPCPEPLLAPPLGFAWDLIWSSDDPHYGGPGITWPFLDAGWGLPAESTIALRAIPQTRPRRQPKERHAPRAEQ
jgi:maltooligosyltrehalose trehalohydrolase